MLRRSVIAASFLLPAVRSLVAQSSAVGRPEIHTFDTVIVDVPEQDAPFKVRFAFAKKPTTAQVVTVVPLDPELPVFDLPVVNAGQIRSTCKPSESSWSGVASGRLAEVQRAKIVVDSFDAVIIYPAVAAARPVPKRTLTDSMLPKNVFVKIVSAAVDLTSDGSPDVVVTRYCCNDPAAHPDNCDQTCQDYYEKRSGQWSLLRHVTPC